jgi:tetratricopeptide (TPR) repeat protein
MVMCQLADRAVEFALEREDYARAALIRRYQGRPEEAERYMAKARGDDEDRMEMVEAGAPREKQTPVTRALDTARAADDPQKTRQALSDALGLLPANDARPATLRELYALLEEHGMAQERKSFEQMLLDPDSEHHAPGIVAAGRAENGPLAQAWHAVLLKTQPGWAPLRRVEHAVAIAEGKLDRDDLQQEMERAEQYAGENPGEGIVEYGRLANRWRPQPNEHVVAKVLDLLADTCLAYDMNVQAARYMTRADELAPDAGSRADQAAWVLVDAEKWTEAAQAFARAYENRSSSSPLFALRYYRGWCLERAGRQEEGRRQQRLAKVEARMSGSTLMRPLLRTYQLDAGLSEWRTARRIDPGGVPELVTVPLISEILDDYERAYADRRVQVLSHTLFGSNSYRPRWMMASASYLNTNRGLARLQAGEQVDIEALCDGYIQNTVAEPEGAILLVRGLDSLGHAEQADRVYAAAMEHARADLEENPEGESARNMFTWLAGMCGRDLEEAIAVGEGLLEESPDSAPYLDTLGAAYYAHGDYEKAWRCEARAVKNGVSGWFYEAGKRLWLLQAARFRQAMERSAD